MLKTKLRKFIPYVDYLGLIKMKINNLLISDEKFIKDRYKEVFGKQLDIINPQTFNEKV